MRHSDWYYDFISPYSYFGFLRLQELDPLHIDYHPVLFAELLRQHAQKGPAEIPAKRLWTYRWCAWWAERNNIPFRFPAAHPFNPLPYLRLAIAADNTPEAIGLIYEALWTTGADPADPALVAGLAQSLGVDPADLLSQEVKDRLRRETGQALAAGVFGVPTHIVDQQLFWGAEGTDLLKSYLSDATVLATDEMLRVAGLPIGIERRQD